MVTKNLKSDQKFQLGISVVIPTLGGDVLHKTILNLNNGSLIPDEILIVIPEKFKSNLDLKLLPENVKVFYTQFSGQVAQRIFGFKNVKYLFTLQLDDDILLEKDCLYNLFYFLKKNKYSSVCPTMLDLENKKCFHNLVEPSSSDLFYKLLYKIINGKKGYESGKISKSGLGMGTSIKYKMPIIVDWVPGGCVLHNSHNLIAFNYYILKGKAYAEDLIHSYYLNLNEIKLYHLPDAIAYVDISSSRSLSLISFLKIVYSSTRALLLYNKLSQRKNFRLLLFQFLYFFIYLPSRKVKSIQFKK